MKATIDDKGDQIVLTIDAADDDRMRIGSDLLATVIESGYSSHWARFQHVQSIRQGKRGIVLSVDVRACREEDAVRILRPISAHAMLVGCARLLADPTVTNRYAVAAASAALFRGHGDVDCDGPTADLILQFAFYGKVVYA